GPLPSATPVAGADIARPALTHVAWVDAWLARFAGLSPTGAAPRAAASDHVPETAFVAPDVAPELAGVDTDASAAARAAGRPSRPQPSLPIVPPVAAAATELPVQAAPAARSAPAQAGSLSASMFAAGLPSALVASPAALALADLLGLPPALLAAPAGSLG